jgi:hypothetical protein
MGISQEELESAELCVGSDTSANSAFVFKHIRWTDRDLMWRDACQVQAGALLG